MGGETQWEFIQWVGVGQRTSASGEQPEELKRWRQKKESSRAAGLQLGGTVCTGAVVSHCRGLLSQGLTSVPEDENQVERAANCRAAQQRDTPQSPLCPTSPRPLAGRGRAHYPLLSRSLGSSSRLWSEVTLLCTPDSDCCPSLGSVGSLS